MLTQSTPENAAGVLEIGPRIIIAGTHSGVGKTTVATGLMAAFRKAGVATTSAKVGPDFIDPGYHSLATGRPPRNLDPWLCGPTAMAPLAGRAAEGGELLVVEGVMGLYDGAVDGGMSSTADVAELIDSPVVLVVDASAMSASVAALVRGYRDHDSSMWLAGVILNRVGSEHHRTLLVEALADINMPVLGAIPRDDALTWRDRHLGLIPVAEQPDTVTAAIDRLATVVRDHCDLEELVRLARLASEYPTMDPPRPDWIGDGARVAVAGGAAFTFVYRDNIEAFEAAGAELIPFDPLVDESLPADINGLFVGGGFPEVFADRLADNTALLADVGQAVRGGLITWAECGGLLWLGQTLDERRLAGVIEASGSMTERLTLGYRHATVLEDNPVAPVGAKLRGHEFHYSSITPGGGALELSSRFSTRTEGFASPTMLATYLHQHLGWDTAPAERFIAACAAS